MADNKFPTWLKTLGFIIVAIIVIIFIVLTFGQFTGSTKAEPDLEDVKRKLREEINSLRIQLRNKLITKEEVDKTVRTVFWGIRFLMVASYVGLNYAAWSFNWMGAHELGKLMDLNQLGLLTILAFLFVGSRKTYDIKGLVYYIRDVIENYYYRKFAPNLIGEITDLEYAIRQKQEELDLLSGQTLSQEDFEVLPKFDSCSYPRTTENINAMLSHYFDKYNIRREGGIEIIQQETRFSMNQIEFIVRKVSEAYTPIFLVHLKEPMTDKNLIQYGLEALSNKEINRSQSGVVITTELKKFIRDSIRN